MLLSIRNCLFFALFSLFVIPAHAQLSTEQGLGIACSLVSENHPLTDYRILIYSDGQLSDSSVVKKEKKMVVHLDRDKVYTLRFIKSGYEEKSVLVDTRLPEKIQVSDLSPFAFDLELLKNGYAYHGKVYDYPVAWIAYNKRKGELDYSKTYSNFLDDARR